MTINKIINVEVISGDSPPVTMPVGLQEMKDYLRLEGFADDGSAVLPGSPLQLSLLSGNLTVTSVSLVGQTILSLTREGTEYYEDDTPSDLHFSFNDATGTITFATAGNPGNETVGVLYGALGASSGNYFNFDDDLIEDLIIEGTEWAEKFIGGDDRMHIILPRSIEVTAVIDSPPYALPGPVTSAITVADYDGNDITDTEYYGTIWPKVKTAFCHDTVFSYSAGYSTFPKWVKNAIKAYVAAAYENRGDTNDLTKTERAAAILRPHVKINAFG